MKYLITLLTIYMSINGYTQDILINGNAESGDITGWQRSSSIISVVQSHTTTNSVYPFEGNYFFSWAEGSGENAHLTQQGKIPDGSTSLNLSCVYFLDNIGSVDHGVITIEVLDDNLSSVGSISSGELSQNLGWKAFSLNFDISGIPDAVFFRIDFHGFDPGGNYTNFYLDDIKLEVDICTSNNISIREQIIIGTTCGNQGSAGSTSPIWGSFGPQPNGVLMSNLGEKLEIICLPGNYPFEFNLLYTPRGAQVPDTIGGCPYEGGCNDVTFFHSGDDNGDGLPDCFVSTRWVSRDYGCYDQDSDGMLDWFETIFEVDNQLLTKVNLEFNYVNGPPNPSSPIPGSSCGYFVEEVGPPNVNINPPFPPIPTPCLPRTIGDFLPCDIDFDGDCDENDELLFNSLLGSKRGDSNYNPIFDVDGDGEITSKDFEHIFNQNSTSIDLFDSNENNFLNITPNPIRTSALFSFKLDKKINGKLIVVSLQGEILDVVKQGNFEQGLHEILWNGMRDENSVIPNGIYFLILKTPDNYGVKKFLISR